MLEQPVFQSTLLTDENDNFIFDFPSELFEALGWSEGDILQIDTFAGRIVLTKVDVGRAENSDPAY